MAWNAKPAGAYIIESPEWIENVEEMNAIFNEPFDEDEAGIALEAQAGIIGNMVAESGLNPWRWQNDVKSDTSGYGLVQYTPATGWTDNAFAMALPGWGPNLSTTDVTPGATPLDGQAQCLSIVHNTLGKWVRGNWRTYWDKTQYEGLWEYSQEICDRWNTEGQIKGVLPLKDFFRITSVEDATFAFMACFEGPAVPNYTTRLEYALIAYKYLSGAHRKRKGMPIWMALKLF